MEDGKRVSGNLNKLIARSYPSVDHHPEEFVVLEKRANSPAKVNLFKSIQDAMKDGTFNNNRLGNLRAFLAVGLYFSDTRIYTTYGNQASRISRVLLEIWIQLKTVPSGPEVGPNWQEEWIEYMDAQWNGAYTKLIKVFDDKSTAMVKEYKCKEKNQAARHADCVELLKIVSTWENKVDTKKLEKLTYTRNEGSAVGTSDINMEDA